MLTFNGLSIRLIMRLLFLMFYFLVGGGGGGADIKSDAMATSAVRLDSC